MKEILELERRHVARQGPIPSAARLKPRTAHVPGPKKLVGSSRFTLNHLGHVAHPKLKPHNIAVGDKGEVRRSDTGTVASVLVQVPLGTCTIVYPQTSRHGKVLAQESQYITVSTVSSPGARARMVRQGYSAGRPPVLLYQLMG